jgi:hypothetical protein
MRVLRRPWAWAVFLVVCSAALIGGRWYFEPIHEGEFGNGQYRLRFLEAGTSLNYSDRDLQKSSWNSVTSSLGLPMPPARQVRTGRHLNLAGQPCLALLFDTIPMEGVSDRGAKPGLLEIHITDSRGVTYINPAMEYGGSFDGTVRFWMEAFPRREPELTVAVFEVATGREFLNFKIPNPALSDSGPTWSEQPAAAQTVGDVRVELKSFASREHALADAHRSLTVLPSFVPQLDVRVDGMPTSNGILQYWCEDSSGNAISDGLLSPWEPAWKIHARVYRDFNLPPRPEEIRPIARFPVPRDTGFQKVDAAGTIGGVPVPTIIVASAGSVIIDGDRIEMEPPRQDGVTGIEFSERRSSKSSIPVGCYTSDKPFALLVSDSKSISTLTFCVQDEEGRLLNDPSEQPSGDHAGKFVVCVPFTPIDGTPFVQLSAVVKWFGELTFDVAPPAELRGSVQTPP